MRFSLSKRAVAVAALAVLCCVQGRVQAASQWAPPSLPAPLPFHSRSSCSPRS